MRKHWGRTLAGWALVGLFAGHAAAWWTLPLLRPLEALLYDLRVNAIAPRTVVMPEFRPSPRSSR